MTQCQCRRHRFSPWVRKIPWRREWLPTPIFLPGKPDRQRRLAGYSPWGYKDLKDWTTRSSSTAKRFRACILMVEIATFNWYNSYKILVYKIFFRRQWSWFLPLNISYWPYMPSSNKLLVWYIYPFLKYSRCSIVSLIITILNDYIYVIVSLKISDGIWWVEYLAALISDFISKELSITAVFVLSVSLLFSHTADPSESQELWCQCIQTQPDFISPKFIAKVQIIPKGAHCNRKEIMYVLKM